MKRCKLRIAWSVAWGAVAVLLVVLWVRSYLYHDRVLVRYHGPGHVAGAVSAFGAIQFGEGDTPDLGDRQFAVISKSARQSPIDSIGPLLKMRAVSFTDWHLAVPIWMLVLLVTMAGSGPWLQFSLCTLLTATTLIAVGLAFIIWATK
jgi:hypothetical protein